MPAENSPVEASHASYGLFLAPTKDIAIDWPCPLGSDSGSCRRLWGLAMPATVCVFLVPANSSLVKAGHTSLLRLAMPACWDWPCQLVGTGHASLLGLAMPACWDWPCQLVGTGHASLLGLAMPACWDWPCQLVETGHASWLRLANANLLRLAMPASYWTLITRNAIIFCLLFECFSMALTCYTILEKILRKQFTKNLCISKAKVSH